VVGGRGGSGDRRARAGHCADRGLILAVESPDDLPRRFAL
jgi:hypothetical protein